MAEKAGLAQRPSNAEGLLSSRPFLDDVVASVDTPPLFVGRGPRRRILSVASRRREASVAAHLLLDGLAQTAIS